jgi:hypothetical protein
LGADNDNIAHALILRSGLRAMTSDDGHPPANKKTPHHFASRKGPGLAKESYPIMTFW